MATGIRLTDIALHPSITQPRDLFYTVTTTTLTAGTSIGTVSGSYGINALSIARGLTSTCLSAEFASYNNLYTTVNTNSGTWSSASISLQASINTLSSLLFSSSGRWDNTYSTVNTNSANWQKGYSDTLTYNSLIATTTSSITALSAVINTKDGRLIEKFGFPVQVTSGMVMAITKDGRVVGWGAAPFYPYDNIDGNKYPYPLTFVPFYQNDGTDYLRQNPTVRAVDLWYGDSGAIALLSDNTVWVNTSAYRAGTVNPLLTANNFTYGFGRVGGNFGGQTPSKISMTCDSIGLSGVSFAVITTSNNLWVWGFNANGQLGLGTTLSSYDVPTQVTALNGVASKCVFGGGRNNVSGYVVTNDRRLFVTGINARGQLGQGNTSNLITWTVALSRPGAALGGVQDIAYASWGRAANTYVIVLSNTGTGPITTVWSAGANTAGQLGLGTTIAFNQNATHFCPVTALSNSYPITGVDEIWHSGSQDLTAHGHVIAKLANKTGFYTWGSNFFGQCGTNPARSFSISSNLFALSTPNLITVVEGISGIKTNTTILCAQSGASSYITTNNTLYTAGYNSVNNIGWTPNTPGSSTLTTVGFSALRVSIPSGDTIKDWLHINRSPGGNAGMLLLTQRGRVYGIGVNDSDSLNGRSVGSAVLLL